MSLAVGEKADWYGEIVEILEERYRGLGKGHEYTIQTEDGVNWAHEDELDPVEEAS